MSDDWDGTKFEKDGWRYSHNGGYRERITPESLPTSVCRGSDGTYYVGWPDGRMEKCVGGWKEADDRMRGQRQSRY